MFFGHLAVGLATKKVVPKVPLGVLLAAALAPDILAIPGVIIANPTFDHVPWSHGLFMSVVWSIVAALLTALISRNPRTSMVMGLLVFSHWVLDFISWPLWPPGFGRGLPLFFGGSAELGLGLYSTTAGSLAGELAGLILVGVLIFSFVKGNRDAKKISSS